MSWFSQVPLAPPIEILAIREAFEVDHFEKKVHLAVGAFRTDEGEPWVLPVVRAAEKALANDKTSNKEYLPTLGREEFGRTASKLLLGDESIAIKENRVIAVQSLSGSGALRVAAEFLVRIMNRKIIYVSNPTWGSHELIFKAAGFELREYRYFSTSTRSLDFEGLIEDLNNAPEGSVIILHACAHNPTGCDPTNEQWIKIAQVIKARKLLPFFDTIYQGFATGDLNKDAFSVRHFVEAGLELLSSQSFAKNFGLYGERVGSLIVVVNNSSLAAAVKSQITLIVRGMYSNPPSHGANIVQYVLQNTELYAQWLDNVKTMAGRILQMRKALREALENLGTPGDWSHITKQIGMFSYTGLSEIQSKHLVKKYRIYMLPSGRISICGLNTSNVDYVAKAIYEAVTTLP